LLAARYVNASLYAFVSAPASAAVAEMTPMMTMMTMTMAMIVVVMMLCEVVVVTGKVEHYSKYFECTRVGNG